MSSSPFAVLPRHVGIIMDGNRRWAKEHGLELLRGHERVSDEVIEPLIDRCIELGIPYVTLWAFSTENWNRDEKEVSGLMQLFRRALQKSSKRLMDKGVKLKAIGDISRFPEDISAGLVEWMKMSEENTKITVNFALNYGGRDEIIRAVNKALEAHPEKITDELLSQHLDTSGMPDLDLLIRPGGEKRLSGFLPWQSVYAELYFTDVLMPDFTPEELDTALGEFSKRKRRFGK